MKNKRKRAACLLLALLCAFQLLTVFCVTAFAEGETAAQSGVLEDLQRDPDFNVADYPENAEDHSVQVIQIAEGANGELFVYVYRPEGTTNAAHRAKYINMSLQNPTDENVNITNSLYSLTWLNSNGTLEKYQVNGFTVLSDTYRYYNIAAVYRAYDAETDTVEDTSIDDVTDCKGFAVGLYFKVYYYNDTLIYEAREIDVVDIDIEAVGYVRYTEGFKLYYDRCDAHFVAFSIANFDVTHIYDADITYSYQTCHWETGYEEAVLTPEVPLVGVKTLTDTDTGSNDGDGWFGKKYEWQRILNKDEFQQQVNDYTNEGAFVSQGAVDSAEFVFQFLETDYTATLTEYTIMDWTKVTSVGILRLHFATPTAIYDLGVVSDLVSDDGAPDAEVTILDNFEGLFEWCEKFMAVLLLILLVVVLWPFINPIVSGIFKLAWHAIKTLFHTVGKVIMWPFKLIERLLFPKK